MEREQLVLHHLLEQHSPYRLNYPKQRTLTMGGRITVRLTSLFDWFRLAQTSKTDANATEAKQLNPNNINRGYDVQWYFPLNPGSHYSQVAATVTEG